MRVLVAATNADVAVKSTANTVVAAVNTAVVLALEEDGEPNSDVEINNLQVIKQAQSFIQLYRITHYLGTLLLGETKIHKGKR